MTRSWKRLQLHLVPTWFWQIACTGREWAFMTTRILRPTFISKTSIDLFEPQHNVISKGLVLRTYDNISIIKCPHHHHHHHQLVSSSSSSLITMYYIQLFQFCLFASKDTRVETINTRETGDVLSSFLLEKLDKLVFTVALIPKRKHFCEWNKHRTRTAKPVLSVSPYCLV
jgi:hypothetical protein